MRKLFDTVTFAEFVRIEQPSYFLTNLATRGTKYPDHKLESVLCFPTNSEFRLDHVFQDHVYFMNRDYNREDE